MHSTFFASPVWPKIYTKDRTELCYRLFKATEYATDHQIESGLSLGVFDKEYEFRRPEAARLGGKLYWDLEDVAADEQKLLAQMDFPLVSVAFAHDSFYPLDSARLASISAVLPQLSVRNRVLQERDLRDPGSWQATGPGQVMFRNGTATKVNEGGRGFMKVLARYMMRKAAAEGFRGIQIVCLHDAVNRVWSRPPEPFKAAVVSRSNCASDEDTEIRESFRGSEQEMTKVYVALR